MSSLAVPSGVDPVASSTTSASLSPVDVSVTGINEPIEGPEFIPNEVAPAASKGGRLGHSIFALMDQGLVSCGNFLTNVLLARSLEVSEYGRYALLLDAILFFNSLQAALIIYPLSVRLPPMQQDRVRKFAGTCVALTVLLSIPLGIMMFIYGTAIGGAGSGSAKIALWAALGQTLWQCQETVRKTMFARGQYANALPGDMVSYLGQAVIIGLFVWSGKANVSVAFAAIAVTSLLACIVQASQLKIQLTSIIDSVKYALSFWRTGRWVLVSNLSTFVSSVCCSFLLFRSHGEAAVGRFAAIANILRPSNPLLIAMATLIVPAVALASSKSGTLDLREAMRVTRKHTLQGIALLAPYWFVLLAMPTLAIRLFYPHRPEYQALGNELRIFVASYSMILVNMIVASMLNGFNRSRRALAAQLMGAAASAAITIPLTIKIGLDGYLWGTLISNGVVAVSLIYLLVRLERHLASEALRKAAIAE